VITQYPLITVSKTKDVLKNLLLEEKLRWVKNESNLGLNGDIGEYYSLYEHTMSKELYQLLKEIAPKQDGLLLEEIVVNHYPKGGFIPMHIDQSIYLGCEVLQLTQNEGEGLTYENELAKEVFIADKKGFCNRFSRLDIKHSVKPVKHDRYSVIYLFR
jgi:hypothetical protein